MLYIYLNINQISCPLTSLHFQVKQSTHLYYTFVSYQLYKSLSFCTFVKRSIFNNLHCKYL